MITTIGIMMAIMCVVMGIAVIPRLRIWINKDDDDTLEFIIMILIVLIGITLGAVGMLLLTFGEALI